MERTVGDIVGTRKRYLRMARKPLTEARETSYWILSSLLTAECSTIELPGNVATLFIFIPIQRSKSCHFNCGDQPLAPGDACTRKLRPAAAAPETRPRMESRTPAQSAPKSKPRSALWSSAS